MAAIRQFLTPRANILTCIRHGSHWNMDWKPGPVPKTPEERAAAARKYGLRVEDYETYSDEGRDGLFPAGDYPKLPDWYYGRRDPWEDYDDPHYKRNYGDPLHYQDDTHKEGFNDPFYYQYDFPVTHTKMVKNWIVIMAFFAAVVAFGNHYPIFQSTKPKQFPYWKKTGPHYTFEPAE